MIESKRLPRGFSTVPSPAALDNTPLVETKATLQEQIDRFLFLLNRSTAPTTMLMWQHYFGGRGTARSLRSFGLARSFESHPDVRRAVSSFARSLLPVAIRQARRQCGRNRPGAEIAGFFFEVNDRTSTNVTNVRELFPIGRSNLVRRAKVNTNLDCRRGRLDINARMIFDLTDAFVDVLDLRSTIPGNQDIPTGVGFPIFHRWAESFVRRNISLR